MSERRIPFSKPPYAALWKASIWRIQLVSGFHLGKIWALSFRDVVTAYGERLTVCGKPEPRSL